MSKLTLILSIIGIVICSVNAEEEVCVPAFFDALNSLQNLDELWEFSQGTNNGATNQLNEWQDEHRIKLTSQKEALLQRITSFKEKYDENQTKVCKNLYISATASFEKGSQQLQELIVYDHVPFVIGMMEPTYDENRAYIKELVEKCPESPCADPALVEEVKGLLAGGHNRFCEISYEVLGADEKKSVHIRRNTLYSIDKIDMKMEGWVCTQK